MILKGSLNAECRFLKSEDNYTSQFNIQPSLFTLPLKSSTNYKCRTKKCEVI